MKTNEKVQYVVEHHLSRERKREKEGGEGRGEWMKKIEKKKEKDGE